MSPVDSDLLDQAAAHLREALLVALTPSLGTLSLGMRSSTGREIPILLQRLANGELLVSDAGETWGELVMTGHASVRPSKAQSERLKRLGDMYKVGWDHGALAFEALCTFYTLPDAARRVTAASIALDGWRALSDQPDVIRVARTPNLSTLSARVAEKARSVGWHVTENQSLAGKTGFSWPTVAVLDRKSTRVGIRVSHSKPEVAIEQAVGCAVDTNTPIVLVAKTEVPDSFLHRAAHVAVIPGLAKATPRQILEAVDRLASQSSV